MKYSVRAFPIAELPVPGWECYFGRNDCSLQTLTFYVWVLQGGGKNIVVDAGPPPDPHDFEALSTACQAVDPRSAMKRLRSLEEVFALAGITAESINALVISQPITYNSGGLVESMFPNATIHLPLAGMLDFLLGDSGHPVPEAFFTESTWNLLRKLKVAGRLVISDGPLEIAEDLTIETTGGHHPGSVGIKVSTAKGLIGILETAFTKENIDDAHPIGIAENAALCRRTIRRYKRECEILLAAHDPTLLQRFPEGVIA